MKVSRGWPIAIVTAVLTCAPGCAEKVPLVRTPGGDAALTLQAQRVALRVDGLFFEVHPDPDRSPSDGPNMVKLDEFPAILDGVLAVYRAVRGAR